MLILCVEAEFVVRASSANLGGLQSVDPNGIEPSPKPYDAGSKGQGYYA